MSGLVVTDLGGGDLCFAAVDDELWDQITEYRETVVASFADRAMSEGGGFDRAAAWECVAWLAQDDPECDRPKGAPDRRGKVLGQVFTQTGVIEPTNLNGVRGILVLP